MPVPMTGFNALFLLGEEDPWGTPVARTHALPITRHSVEPQLDVRDIPYLGVANNQQYHNTSKSVLLSHNVGGDIEGCAAYDSKAFALLLKHAMGAVATTGPSTTQYTHTFTLDSDGVEGLTGEANDGSGIDDTAEVFGGLVVSQFELNVNAQDVMTYRASVLGRGAGGMGEISDDFAIASCEEVLAHQCGAFTWNTHTPNLRGLKLTINNNLVRRPFLGSLYTDKPCKGGFASVLLDLTLAWEEHDLYTDFLAQAQGDASLNFTGSGDNRMNFDFHNLKLLAVGKPVQTAGELMLNVRAKCFAAAGEQGCRIVLKNSNITAI